MPRKLKAYRTSLGFFDLAVAAPSMKGALEAWGAKSNLFQRGFAEETKDPLIVAATMAKPGVVLKRAVGSDGEFGEHAVLPKLPPLEESAKPARPERRKPSPRSGGDAAAREAAVAFETEQRRREDEQRRREDERHRHEAAKEKQRKRLEAAVALEWRREDERRRREDEQRRQEEERRREEAAKEKQRRRREAAVTKAETALERAGRDHDRRAQKIERERAALDRRSEAERARWEKHKQKLEADLRKARDD